MGNHAAGEAIYQSVVSEASKRASTDSALDVLDRGLASAKLCHGFSGDAEFEAADPKRPGYVHPVIGQYTDPHPATALGMLMVEAFAPNGLRDLSRYWPMLEGVEPGDDGAAEEAATAAWWDEVYLPFKKRYNLY